MEEEQTIIPMKQLFGNYKYIVDTSYGRSAMFLFEVPLKMMSILYSNYLKPNTKFRFIEERFANPFIHTFAMSRRLSQTFRRQINLRLE